MTEAERVAEVDFREQYRHIGRKIAYYRRLKGYTQVQFAEKVGISSNYLSQIECGRRDRYSIHRLMVIADALDVPLKEMFE